MNTSLEGTLRSQVRAAHDVLLHDVGNQSETLIERLRSDPFSSTRDIDYHTYTLALPVAHALAEDARFSDLYGAYYDLGTGPCPVRIEDVAIALLRVALIDGIREAIKWLLSVQHSTSAEGWVVQSVWGIDLHESVVISDAISLVPFKKIPDSFARTQLIGRSLEHTKTAFDHATPSAALLYRTTISEVLIPKARLSALHRGDDRKRRSDVSLHFEKLSKELCDIASLIGVIKPQISIPGASWFTFVDRDIERLRTTIKRRFENMEVHPPTIPWELWLDEERTLTVLRQYFGCSESMRAKVMVAVERLGLALRRSEPAEKAVEISIALEALLSDGENNEISHKVRTRAVRLMGGSIEARRTNSAVIKSTYEMRSKLVHAGAKTARAKNIDGRAWAPWEITRACVKLASELILQVLEDATLPNWSDFDIS